MVFSFDPPNVQVAAGGATATHQLKNEGVARMAFKIKTSNNACYRIKPVYGFIEPAASVAIEIVRQPGPPGEDKMAIQFAEVPPEETNPKAPFKAQATQGEIVSNLIAN